MLSFLSYSDMSCYQSLSWGSLYGMPRCSKTALSVGVLSGTPGTTFRPRSRTTPAFSECSDRLMALVLASARMERLKWAEPVKYSKAHANSSCGTTITSSLRWRWPGPGRTHTPMYFFCSPFSSWLTKSSVKKPGEFKRTAKSHISLQLF